MFEIEYINLVPRKQTESTHLYLCKSVSLHSIKEKKSQTQNFNKFKDSIE